MVTQILIVEDVAETRRWLCDIVMGLYTDCRITELGDLSGAEATLAQTVFDLILLDINLPDGLGTDLIPACRNNTPQGHIVVTTVYDDDVNVFRALRTGADGYLLKTDGEEEFADKLAGIARGEVPISPAIARRMLTFFSELKPLANKDKGISELTEREQDILTLVAKGYRRREIASLLGISINTTSSYIRDVYRKLGITSRSEAASEAIRLGLVNLDL